MTSPLVGLRDASASTAFKGRCACILAQPQLHIAASLSANDIYQQSHQKVYDHTTNGGDDEDDEQNQTYHSEPLEI